MKLEKESYKEYINKKVIGLVYSKLVRVSENKSTSILEIIDAEKVIAIENIVMMKEYSNDVLVNLKNMKLYKKYIISILKIKDV